MPEGQGLSGWSRALLHESANPPGVNRASCPGYMVGTLWADKVLPGDRTRATGRTGQRRKDSTESRDAQTCTNATTRGDTHLHHHHHTQTHRHTHKGHRKRQTGKAVRNVQALRLRQHIPTRAKRINTHGCAHGCINRSV